MKRPLAKTGVGPSFGGRQHRSYRLCGRGGRKPAARSNKRKGQSKKASKKLLALAAAIRERKNAGSAVEQKNLREVSKRLARHKKKSFVHLIRGAQVLPMLGWEVVESQQRIAILVQALGRLSYFTRVALDEVETLASALVSAI